MGVWILKAARNVPTCSLHQTLQVTRHTTPPIFAPFSLGPKMYSTLGFAFDISDRVGELRKVLKVYETRGLTLTRIENRPHPLAKDKQRFVIHTEVERRSDATTLKREIQNQTGTVVAEVAAPTVPWFPRTLRDIDSFSTTTLDAGKDLYADHPGFHDPAYRQRRQQIALNSWGYHSGSRIPEVTYHPTETECWRKVYTELSKMFKECAAKEYLESIQEMEICGVYSPLRVPQLQDVSDYIESKSGFTLRPVTGLLSGRDFLNALGLRVFFSTQYIRHPSQPFYTPEPDVIHELIGHAPMLANREFADFSQILGIASLGASDVQIKLLASCYWFSVEFGILSQGGNMKAYGAGLLSSIGELIHAIKKPTEKANYVAWDPQLAAHTAYPITEYQPLYFVSPSLQQVRQSLLKFSEGLPKPFFLRYDSATKSIISDVNLAYLETEAISEGPHL